MVPIVARTKEDILRLVHCSYREAAIGLCATQEQTIEQEVIPAAKGSLVTGVMLAIARVAGETAPLLFTAMGSRFNPVTLNGTFPFVHIQMGPGFPSLTVQIFEYARAPSIDQNRQAWAGILILITLIFILNLAIRFFASKTRSK
jgi:phosphate transport system permease protein